MGWARKNCPVQCRGRIKRLQPPWLSAGLKAVGKVDCSLAMCSALQSPVRYNTDQLPLRCLAGLCTLSDGCLTLGVEQPYWSSTSFKIFWIWFTVSLGSVSAP